MLDKDQSERSSITEIAELPCVRAQIEKFIREQDCLDEVVGVLPDKITMIETGEN